MRRLLLLLPIMMISASAHAWRIPSIQVLMQVQPDSSIIVTETITADFTGDPHHGIYREIPLSVRDHWGNNWRLRFDLMDVTDANGAKLQVKATMKPGGRVHVRIGSPYTMVDNLRVYVIRYKLLRAVHYFELHDEIYWNAIGHEWEVPIEDASCTVILPSDVPAGRIRTASYTGMYGSTLSEAQSEVRGRRQASFWMNRPVSPGEAMTIVVGWPKGIVKQPSFAQAAGWFVGDNGYFFLPPIFLLFLFGLWARAGRDPETGRSEMVSFDPPDDLRPAELGALIDEKVDMRDISATIIDLAVRGYLKITAEVEKGFLTSKTDYLLELQKPYEATISDMNLSPFERKLIEGMFSGDQSCRVSSLKNKFYTHLPTLRDYLYDGMVKRGYFAYRPDKVRLSYRILGLAMAGLGIVLAFVVAGGSVSPTFAVPIGWHVAFALCGLMLAVAAGTMPRKTAQGKNALLAARGFEEYLSRAERQEIEYQERQNYFERFLPYAMAFGIAEKWAQAFEGLQTKPPDWYSGDGTFRPTLFAHDMDSASGSWASAMSSTPRSSGGGGSGFSGGSSGGGGGGGGGGAW